MVNQRNIGLGNPTLVALGLLCLLIFGAYANTFQSSWHLDDFPTLVNNPRLQLEDLSGRSIIAAFHSRPGSLGKSYRPVSCLSLALNWYVGGQQVAGYHLVNIGIHVLTAFILYLTIFNLFRSPRMVADRGGQAVYVAFLAAALWALNPVQTQAVTYIVQRMASLAALFYILGMYGYVKGRISPLGWHRFLYFFLVAVCYALAVGSKENAIILPLTLFLTEVVFFQNLDSAKTRFRARVAAAAIAIALLFSFFYVIYFADDLAFLRGYQHRGFTLGQRLLTQPRVTIFYLSQLFYPMPQRLSIEHGLELSTSFFEPWTTAPALAAVLFLIGLAIYSIRKKPVLAFALLFFFVNHLIESTVLPLELAFEHRNYLPSLFLFFPVASVLIGLGRYYRHRSRFIQSALVLFMMLLLLGLGISTYIRNSVWATETSLWEDAVRKAPGRARPAYNLAKQYAQAGHLDAAMALYQKALALEASRPRHTRAMTLNGIASIYYMKREYEKALLFCQKALVVKPEFEPARYNMVLVLAKLNRWDRLNDQIDFQLTRHPNSRLYLYLKGELLLKQNQPLAALDYLRKALNLSPSNKNILLNIGLALNALGSHRQAEWFLKRVRSISPHDMRPFLYLIEIALKQDHTSKTERYLEDLVKRFTARKLHSALRDCFNDAGLTPASQKLICSAVDAKINQLADKMMKTGSF